MRAHLVEGLLIGLLGLGCSGRGSRAGDHPVLSRTEASQIAIAKVAGGTILDGDLDRERLVWIFDIARPGTRDRTEATIDAMEGKVLSTRRLRAADEDVDERPRR